MCSTSIPVTVDQFYQDTPLQTSGQICRDGACPVLVYAPTMDRVVVLVRDHLGAECGAPYFGLLGNLNSPGPPGGYALTGIGRGGKDEVCASGIKVYSRRTLPKLMMSPFRSKSDPFSCTPFTPVPFWPLRSCT